MVAHYEEHNAATNRVQENIAIVEYIRIRSIYFRLYYIRTQYNVLSFVCVE